MDRVGEFLLGGAFGLCVVLVACAIAGVGVLVFTLLGLLPTWQAACLVVAAIAFVLGGLMRLENTRQSR